MDANRPTHIGEDPTHVDSDRGARADRGACLHSSTTTHHDAQADDADELNDAKRGHARDAIATQAERPATSTLPPTRRRSPSRMHRLDGKPLEQLVQELDPLHRVCRTRLAVERRDEMLTGTDHGYPSTTAALEQLRHRLVSVRLRASELQRTFSHDISSSHPVLPRSIERERADAHRALFKRWSTKADLDRRGAARSGRPRGSRERSASSSAPRRAPCRERSPS